jgi:autotransporter-associated beta strand protein
LTKSTTTLTVLSGTFSGQISGAGALVKAGAGALTLAGLQTFTGGTTVSEGTLSVSGEIGDVMIDGGTFLVTGSADDIMVNAGGILMGTGTVGGIGLNGGILSPGQSPGTLSAFALEWVGGIMEYELGPTPLLSDHLALTGILTGSDSQYLFRFLDEGAVVGATYDLISFQASEIAIGDFGLANTDGFSGLFSYNQEGTILRFTVSQVPEPGTAALLGAAALAWLRRRRRVSESARHSQ